ncbi:MAG: T9SS type A sorting domain-containing protein [Cyclobacteriaceae bacterium]|jgi:hypothetical protein
MKIRLLTGVLLLPLLIGIGYTTYAQTGPGGVGNANGSGGQPENILWLDAASLSLTNGASIASWPDQSGNDLHFGPLGADATPVFQNNGLFSGNHAVARFDGTERYLKLDDNDKLDGNLSSLTILIVSRSAVLDGRPRGLFSKRLSTDSQESYSAFTYSGNNMNFDIRNSSDNRMASSIALNTTTDYIHTLKFDGSTQSIFVQGASAGSRAVSGSGNIRNTTSDLILGALNENYGDYFNGDIAEILVYGEALGEAQQVITENYLSAKYNIALTSNDVYKGDDGGNGDYDDSVIGIGQFGGDTHEDAVADGLVLSTYDGSLDTDGEFLFGGHDGTSNAVVISDLGTDIQARWARTWYIDRESGGTLNAAIAFDFGDGLGGQFPQDPNGYVLLKWNGSTYDSVTVATADKYVSGDRVVFRVTDALLTDGVYTLGTTNNDSEASPLEGGPNKTWYSYTNGDWDESDTWTLDGAAFPLYVNPDSEIPSDIDNVVISSGKTVTIPNTVNNVQLTNIEVAGRLDLTTSSGHDFGNISGVGRIRLAGYDHDANGATPLLDNFPAGIVSEFSDPVTGGTVEFYGDGISLNNTHTFNDVEINLSNATDIACLLDNYTIYGGLTVVRGIFKVNDDASTTALTVQVEGDILVEANGQVAVGQGNARHQLNLYGSLINNGDVALTNRAAANYGAEATDGIVDANFLSSNQDQEIQCNGHTRFYRIEIDKGTDATYILDITTADAANFELFGPANYGHAQTSQLTENNNALGLIRGTVRVGTDVNIPVLNNTGNYNISEAAQIWVDGGLVAKPNGTAIVPYGTARVSAGTFEALISSGFTLRDNGTIWVEGGIMNTNQIRTSVLGASNVGGYIQTGGTVNVVGGSTNTDWYVFNLTYPGNVFTMTGGILNILGANSKGGIFINSDPDNINVTEGIVNMEINNANDFIITSRAPFYNITMDNVAGNAALFVLDQGVDVASSDEYLSAQPLLVKNNFTIEANTFFDHNGNNVEIGRDFTIQAGGDYIYDAGKPNTTTINGTANSLLAFYNRTAAGSDVQVFHNLTINKPSNAVVSLASGKTGGNLNQGKNRLLRVTGDAFKLLSGTLDQGVHRITIASDTLVNYDVFTIYDPVNATANGNNDVIEFEKDDFVLMTADTSVFGNVEISSGNSIIELQSDVLVQRFNYQNGRINLQNHRLTIDKLDFGLDSGAKFDFSGDGDTDDPGEENVNSPADMLITSGNASDGGLSLYINDNGTYTFPFGIGTDATVTSAGTSKYTPATITISNFSDDGYITINLADAVLQTLNDGSTDALSYYWRVRYEGFTDLPDVAFDFTYDEDDVVGTEGSYVPGRVVAGSFEREQLVGSVNTTTKLIQNTPGSVLKAGNYIAGTPAKFTGTVNIYYTRQFGNAAGIDWQNTNYWTLAPNDLDSNGQVDSYELHDSRQPSAGAYPQAGDVAIVGWVPWTDPNTGDRGKPHGIAMNRTETFADLEFSQMLDASGNPTERIYANNFQFRPTVVFNTGGQADVAKISGEGAFWCRQTTDPAFSLIDMGDFSNEDSSYFIYEYWADVTYNNIPSILPNVLFAADGWGANNRNFTIASDITVNQDCELLGNGNFIMGSGVMGDITVNGDLLIFRNNASGNDSGGYGEISFPNNASRSIEVFGNLQLLSTGALINIRSADSTVNVSNLIVHGNIIQNSNDGGTEGLQLYPGAALDYVQLQLRGEGNHSYTRLSGDEPSLYNLILNKGSSTASSFSFDNSFSLNGATDGTAAEKCLQLQNGLLILNNSAIDIDLTTGGGNFLIPAAAGLEVQEGTVRASGDDTGILLDGLLRINNNGNAYLDGAGNGNNYIQYSASGNATLEIADNGELVVGSQIRRGLTASTGILRYSQTGGAVEVGKNAAPEANRGVFEITSDAGSSFTHTGGDLYIARQNGSNPSIAALYLDPETSNVSNSTITIGNGNTPANQTIGVNANIALSNVIIDNTSGNNPAAQMQVRPLTIAETLTMGSGTILDANTLDLTLMGDFVNNGTFVANNNTTIFSASSAQSLSGASETVFWNLIKSNSNTLTLSQLITVDNDLAIEQGTLADAGYTITVEGNVLNDGIHTSSGGAGIVLNGEVQQQITRSGSGTSAFGVLTINNSDGVIIPESNGYNFTVNNALRMGGGVFNIGSSLLTISESAIIEEVSTFSANNMVQTNSSFTDSGLRKLFAAGTTTDFTFPVGEDEYTPATLVLSGVGNTSGSTSGSIVVIPAHEYHPVINDGTETTAPTDFDNVLHYYWTVDGNNLSGFNAEFVLQYDQADVYVNSPYSEADYIPARILSDNNLSGNINKFATSLVDENTNEISFIFNNVTDAGLSGDYFSGVDEAIPDAVPTYTTTGINDGYTDQDSWNEAIPAGGPVGSIIIVQEGHTLTIPGDGINVYRTEIQSDAVLDVGTTIKHRLGIVSGQGTIRVEGNTLPAGFYNEFFLCPGGGLEYAGATDYDILGSITNLQRMTLSDTGERRLPNAHINICDDLTIVGPRLINENDINLTIGNNLIAQSGTFETGSNNIITIDGNLLVSGGTYQGETGHTNTVAGNVNISSGSFSAGTNSTLNISGDLIFSGGSFGSSSGNALIRMQGSVNQSITGEFTAANTADLNRLEIDNSAGVTLAGNTDIKSALLLTDGLVSPGANKLKLETSASATPSTGKANSYVDGPLYKDIANGESFTFPVGKGSRWGYASVENISGGAYEWNVEYFNDNPQSVFGGTSSDGTIQTISGNEYWRIADDAPVAGTLDANIGIMWDGTSNVSANSTDWYNLKVLVWNGTMWDTYGGTGHESNPTPSQSHGFFTSTDVISFSENFVTMGSTTSNNPLPVELVAFNVQAEANQVLLTWETASEINNDFFEIQRSQNAKDWEAIGTVAGAGNSTRSLEYQYKDKYPIIGESYYRLRQVDYDGKFDYSKIRSITVEAFTQLNTTVLEIRIYPNPSDGPTKLRIEGLANYKPVTIRLLDVFGKVQETVQADSEILRRGITINQQGRLPAGLYFVDIQQENLNLQRKLILR